MTHAAIDAQAVDCANDPRHKGFIRVILHVPAERGELLTKVLGWPTYTTPVPVALARLNAALPGAGGDVSECHSPDASASDVERRPPINKYAQRAGILCNDSRFQGFLMDRYGGGIKILDPVERREWAAETVREVCEVGSRRDIQSGTAAANRFDLLESAYLAEHRI